MSDRFHILKNLTTYAKDYLKKSLNQRISIQISDNPLLNNAPVYISEQSMSNTNRNRQLTLEEKYDRVLELSTLGYTKTKICKELNMDIRVYNKLESANQSGIEDRFKVNSDRIHIQRITEKQKLVNEARQLRCQGLSFRKISQKLSLDRHTVKRYCDEKFNPVHASYGKIRNGLVSPYMKKIDNMMSQGIMGSIIESEIRKDGYTGSASSLRHYIANWKRRFKHEQIVEEPGVEIIERKDIFKLLYNPIDKTEIINVDQYNAIISQYSCFEKIHGVVWGFRALLKSKTPDRLVPWLEEAKGLNISEINSFVEGIYKDIEAVKNAIELSFSSGLIEGCERYNKENHVWTLFI